MNIIIYAIAKNEKKFAERFMRSCAGADGVVVLVAKSEARYKSVSPKMATRVKTALVLSHFWAKEATR